MRTLGMRWCLVVLFLLAPVWAQAATPQVAAGGAHTIGLKSDSTVWDWGRGDFGQLGNDTNTGSYTPVSVNGLTDVVAITAGSFHTVALKRDGTVWAWGANDSGQLGNGL